MTAIINFFCFLFGIRRKKKIIRPIKVDIFETPSEHVVRKPKPASYWKKLAEDMRRIEEVERYLEAEEMRRQEEVRARKQKEFRAWAEDNKKLGQISSTLRQYKY